MRDWLIKKLGGYTEPQYMMLLDRCEIWMEKCKRLEAKYVYPLKVGRRFALVKDAPADTKLPTRGSKNAAGYDFYAPHEFIVPAHGMSSMIHFNIKACMPSDEYLQLKIRSGLSMKHDIMLIGSGVIDADFFENPDNDGNIAARFINHGDVDYVVQKGERCMQGIFLKYGTVADDAANGVRGGGYGSTGKF